MTPNEYSEWRRTVDIYPKGDFTLGYYALGLAAAAALARRKLLALADLGALHALDDELGDVLWYLTALADYYGYTLQDVINANVAKLNDRHARNMARGSGDNR